MTYNATYEADDMPNILVDVLGSAGAQIVVYISLIVLVGILVYVIRKLKR